jgi:CRP-like cAMP-binding protein
MLRKQAPRHTPRDNRLLAALPRAEYKRLLPHLDLVALPRGRTLHRCGAPQEHLYFPSGIVSRFRPMSDGSCDEFALTGNEGVVGIAAFLGADHSLGENVVLTPGFAYRLHRDRLRIAAGCADLLPRLLLRYTQALIAEIGQTAACNRYHSLECQVCRWLLATLDRSSSNDLPVTQELIAGALGVRREGVTATAGSLRKDGVIRYRRGHLAVLDRRRLEARACECYRAVKREYDRVATFT